MSAHPEYDQVPPVAEDAVVDEHWREGAGPGLLPEFYMPATVGGRSSGSRRAIAWVLIAVFLTATGAGVCLTYGPDRDLVGEPGSSSR